jgi:hypothetical protein
MKNSICCQHVVYATVAIILDANLLIIKTEISNLVHTTRFWNNLHHVRSKLINQAIKSGQSKETGNIGYTRRRRTKQKHNTICVGQMIGNPK